MKSPVLMRKGAEASLYLAEWHGNRVILKKRLRKKYRPRMLDEQVRIYRTIHEPRLMHEAKLAGVPTPAIYLVDVKRTTIIMEYIEGKRIKELMNNMPQMERQRICFRIGQMIGLLHKHGVVHGDLTSSNMILDPEGTIFFLDFGLGERSRELEARGVDLHLMQRALESTHYLVADECFDAIFKGYSGVLGSMVAKSVLDKIREIEKRGRYVAERRERE
jgi:TP53 regulating kinase-like protein